MRLVERALVVLGLACLGWYAVAVAVGAYSEHQAREAVEDILASGPAPIPVPAPEAVTPVRPESGNTDAIGLLEIPRLGISTPVVEGDDSRALRGAAGHLPDTPRPWEDGNSAIAAHRDGLFRPLRHVRVGDHVRVRMPQGELVYRVRDTHIVTPRDLSVIAKTPTPTLTLITCYPFYYVGHAPKRFIVHADRVVQDSAGVGTTAAGGADTGAKTSRRSNSR